MILTTSRGLIVVEMVPQAAPQTVARIKALVREGFYDNSLFYRVLPGVLAQTGDRGERRYASGQPPVVDEFLLPAGLVPPAPVPTGDPAPLPPRYVAALPVARPLASRPGETFTAFCPGVAGLAHNTPPNTGESQVFFMMVRAQNLEGAFTAWGRIVIGQEVLAQLATGEPPAAPDRVLNARLAADLPEAERPVLEVQAVDGPTVSRQVAQVFRERNMSPDACEVLPVGRLPGGAPAS